MWIQTESAITPKEYNEEENALGSLVNKSDGNASQNGEIINLPEKIDKGAPKMNDYNLILISVIILIAYAISFIASRKKIIGVLAHRKMWNVFLLITFLVSAILGLLLVIQLNFGIVFPLPFNMLFWHVEAGIVMAIITIFHISWHWPYFKHILKRERK